MSNLGAVAEELLDLLSECVNGPVRGSVTSAATSGSVVVPRGQRGTLADGRVVRCTKATRVTTDGVDVPVRQLFLAPAYPTANNFAVIGGGSPVTWLSPPANLEAAGSVVAPFAAFGADAALVSLVEIDQLAANADPFGAGAQGSALAILLAPEVRALDKSERLARYTRVEIAWRLRVNLSTLAAQGSRRTAARNIFDSLASAVVGGKVGGSIATLGRWSLAREARGVSSYELALVVQTWMRGRTMQAVHAPTQTFDVFAHETSVNPTGQTPDEQVAEDIAIPSA